LHLFRLHAKLVAMAHDCLHPVLSETHSASPILPIKPVSSYHHRKLQVQ
jgi:hypothetical protein